MKMNSLITFSFCLIYSITVYVVETQTTASAVSLSNPVFTSWKQSIGNSKTYSSVTYYTDITSISYTTNGSVDYVYVQAQGIPSYSVGPWSANPNTPSGQNWIYKFPISPTRNTGTLTSTLLSLGQMGAFSNGIAIVSINFNN
jgi:hypothetical protein